jgi:hypothetical protein
MRDTIIVDIIDNISDRQSGRKVMTATPCGRRPLSGDARMTRLEATP